MQSFRRRPARPSEQCFPPQSRHARERSINPESLRGSRSVDSPLAALPSTVPLETRHHRGDNLAEPMQPSLGLAVAEPAGSILGAHRERRNIQGEDILDCHTPAEGIPPVPVPKSQTFRPPHIPEEGRGIAGSWVPRVRTRNQSALPFSWRQQNTPVGAISSPPGRADSLLAVRRTTGRSESGPHKADTASARESWSRQQLRGGESAGPRYFTNL